MPVAEQPQHMQALARANEYRLKRAELKRDIKAGGVRVSDLLRDQCPDWLASMPIEELLCAIRRLHTKTAIRMLGEVPIVFTATVGKLTWRQRRDLAAALDAHEGLAS